MFTLLNFLVDVYFTDQNSTDQNFLAAAIWTLKTKLHELFPLKHHQI